MTTFLSGVIGVYNRVVHVIEDTFSPAFLGLLARVVFAAGLLTFFWRSAYTKVVSGQPSGFFDYFGVEANAFAQIAPGAFEAAGYDASALGFHYWLIGYAATYGEFLLPLFVLIGFLTRLSALGMLGFIGVMTWVDVTGHFKPFNLAVLFDGVPPHVTARFTTETLPRASDHALMDERFLWLFPLIYLVIRGGGWLSVDGILQARAGVKS